MRALFINATRRSVTELLLPAGDSGKPLPEPVMALVNGDRLFLLKGEDAPGVFFWVPGAPNWLPSPGLVVGAGDDGAVSALADLQRMVMWLGASDAR